MVEKQTLTYLRYAHGLFNFLIALFVLFQSSLGLTIRRQRLRGMPQDFAVVRRHRRTGPVLAFLGVSGFFTGIVIAHLNYGRVLRHPPHFSAGLMIALSLLTTLFISRNIKGPYSPWRMPHYLTGLVIVSLYFVQVFLGIRILFL